MLHAIEADLAVWFDREPFGAQVSRLAAYRGFTHQGALMVAAEVCDWRRFASARHFMGFVGLTPSEYSTVKAPVGVGSPRPATPICVPSSTKQPGPTAMSPMSAPASWRVNKDCHQVIARSWKAQQRLCRRYRHLAERKIQQEHRHHCGGTRTRRVRVGRNDRRLNTMSAGRHDLGDVTPGSSATCRSTADADPIPVKLDMPNHPAVATGVVIQGQLSAHPRTAISTRVHHCGGTPNHAPTRRRTPEARAP